MGFMGRSVVFPSDVPLSPPMAGPSCADCVLLEDILKTRPRTERIHRGDPFLIADLLDIDVVRRG